MKQASAHRSVWAMYKIEHHLSDMMDGTADPPQVL